MYRYRHDPEHLQLLLTLQSLDSEGVSLMTGIFDMLDINKDGSIEAEEGNTERGR